MKILSNEIYAPCDFVEVFTACYFTGMSTVDEVASALLQNDFTLETYPLTSTEIPEDANVVIVEFSTEEDYTVYDHRFAVVPKGFEMYFVEMEIISIEKGDECTLYTVATEYGKATVKRNWFPNTNSLWSVQAKDDELIDDREVIDFCLKNVPRKHIATAVWVRKHPAAYAQISDGCFSLEQAVTLGNMYNDNFMREKYTLHYIEQDGKVIKNYLTIAEDIKAYMQEASESGESDADALQELFDRGYILEEFKLAGDDAYEWAQKTKEEYGLLELLEGGAV